MFCQFCGNTAIAGATCATCAAVTPGPTNELRARASQALRDALEALKRTLRDPAGNVGALYEVFGPRRTLDAGIALALAFDLVMVIAVQIGARKTLGFLAPLVFGNSSLLSLIKSMILAAVPPIALIFVLFAAQRALGEKREAARAVFVGGVALIPLGLVALLSAILGAANFEGVAILVVAQISYTALIVFSGCRDVLGIASSKAAAVMPVVFIATGWLSKVVIAALL